MEYAHVWGPHTHWFWIIPFLFMILMIFFATRMARRADGWRCGAGRVGPGRFDCCGASRDSRSDCWSETPAQILDRRYASGEITKEQREQMKRELDSNVSQTGMGAE